MSYGPSKGKKEAGGDVAGGQVSSSEMPSSSVIPIPAPWWGVGRGCVCVCLRGAVVETRNVQEMIWTQKQSFKSTRHSVHRWMNGPTKCGVFIQSMQWSDLKRKGKSDTCCSMDGL